MTESELSIVNSDVDLPSSDGSAVPVVEEANGQTQVSGNVRVVLGFLGGALVLISALLTQAFVSDDGLDAFLADQALTMAIVGAVGLLLCWLCWRTRRPVSDALAAILWIGFVIVMIFGFIAKATKFWLWG